MKKGHNYNILDLGLSKLRFSIFDDKLTQQYSEIRSLFNQNLYLNSNEQITYLIKNAEKKISSHIQDIVLMFDANHLISNVLEENFDIVISSHVIEHLKEPEKHQKKFR